MLIIALSSIVGITFAIVWVVNLKTRALEIASHNMSIAMPSVGGFKKCLLSVQLPHFLVYSCSI